MKTKLRTYEGSAITVTYDAPRCIHAAECIHGLGAVFDPDARPWINPDGASAAAVAETVLRCPTGALKFVPRDGLEEAPPTTNAARLEANGPIYVHGTVEIVTKEGETVLRDTRVALCRCGASKNKPLCDGSHADAKFVDPGKVGTATREDGPPDEYGTLTITVVPNGPLLLSGRFSMAGADGDVSHYAKGAWCRCGASSNKPFCDGTHKRLEAVSGETVSGEQ